jgi:hypothetical protein
LKKFKKKKKKKKKKLSSCVGLMRGQKVRDKIVALETSAYGQHISLLIANVINSRSLPHTIKLYPRNSQQRAAAHTVAERLNVLHETDKKNPLSFLVWSTCDGGPDCCGERENIAYPMYLTITAQSSMPPNEWLPKKFISSQKRLQKEAAKQSDNSSDVLLTQSSAEGLWNGLPLPVLLLVCSDASLLLEDVQSALRTCRAWSRLANVSLLWDARLAIMCDALEMLSSKPASCRQDMTKRERKMVDAFRKIDLMNQEADCESKQLLKKLLSSAGSCNCTLAKHSHSFVRSEPCELFCLRGNIRIAKSMFDVHEEFENSYQ